MLTCPLCLAAENRLFFRDRNRDYYRCGVCSVVFVPPGQHLSRAQELVRYELHQNDLMDQGYRQFLMQLFEPLNQRIETGSKGLDFGSGPGPLLRQMFEDQGHRMWIYDIFYAPDIQVFQTTYDFITASEVLEHLHRPLDELDRLWNCLKPGGWLGIMTGVLYPDRDFPSWHYIRDDTHVLFYAPETFHWLAQRLGASLEFVDRNVILLQKTVTTEELSA